MRLAVAAAGLLLTVPAMSQGAPSLAYSSSAHALALVSQASIPIQLAAGLDDSRAEVTVSLSPNRTGSRVTDTNPGKYEVLYANNSVASKWRLRLALDVITNQSECKKCYLYLKNLSSGDERVHIKVDDGVVSVATGPWENVNVAGQGGDDYVIFAEHDVASGREAQVRYRLEFVPPSTLSPSVAYYNMTFIGKKV